MKTFAEFKRAFILGAKFHTIFHRDRIGRDENGNTIWGDKDQGTREVSIVQTNAVAFRTDRGTDSWLHWPSAKDVIIKDNVLEVWELERRNRDEPGERVKILTYTIIP